MHDVNGTRRDLGFTLAEVLLALLLTVLIISAGLALVVADSTLAQAAPQAMDVQQRARAALMVLRTDLSLAGAGMDAGPLAGSLAALLPPVLPRRAGLVGADAVTFVRSDAVTIAYVPAGASPSILAASVSGSTPTLVVDPLPSCPRSQELCGISAGTSVLIVDETGRHGLYTVTDVTGGTARLRALQDVASAFERHAVVVPIESQTYYFDRSSNQLRVNDGAFSDAPVVDDVVDVKFDYFGISTPPARPKPSPGVPNCLYDAAGDRVPGLLTLPSLGESLTPLPLTIFADGPWCGDGDRRFDADLLRIRAVRMTVRVQAGIDRYRSVVTFNLLGGSNRTPATLVPDLAIVADITPRNLNFGR